MLASSALRRLAVSPVPRSLLARTPATLTPARAATAAHLLARRSYATKAADTEATATVKKAVKAKAKAEGKAAPKKAAPKKTATKKTATKKAAPKKAKKAAPKKPKKPKRELTVDEKTHAKWILMRQRALITQPVSSRPITAYNVYVAEKLKGTTSAISDMAQANKDFADVTPAEREHWNHLASEENVKRAAAYRAWVESFTTEEIRKANLARSIMRNMLKDHQDLKVRKPKYLSQIQDDRSPARPNTPWIEFLVERSNSDDFRGIELTDRVKLMSSEWKAFTEEEKKPYRERAELNAERYRAEMAEAEAKD